MRIENDREEGRLSSQKKPLAIAPSTFEVPKKANSSVGRDIYVTHHFFFSPPPLPPTPKRPI